MLQAGSLLSHLRLAGWRPAHGWEGARLDEEGVLHSVRVVTSGPVAWPQRWLLELSGRLFGESTGELPGRGQARRALRRLLARWDQSLLPLPPDDAVRDLLSMAAFLWDPEHVGARAALGAVHLRGDSARLWVAGPGSFRRRMLTGARDWATLRERLVAAEAPAVWSGSSTVARPPVTRARQLACRGRFETSLALLGSGSGAASERIRIVCKAGLGRLEAARRALSRCRSRRLAVGDRVALAESAVWLDGCRSRSNAAELWLDLALEADREPDRSRAHLLAAQHAWDRQDLVATEQALERARPILDRPQEAWRWRQTAALAALERGRAERACEHLRVALATSRRYLSDFEAGLLWNDLAVARAACGDLARAERASRHAVRLHVQVEGPRRHTLSLCNLAELRLRRGRPEGVRAIVERSVRANLESGNTRALAYDRELQCRFELLRGRPERALERVAEALAELDRHRVEWRRSALHAIAARACGWLGRGSEARRHLDAAGDPSTFFEPEEVPGLLALAGDRPGARAYAEAVPEALLWRRVLDDVPVSGSDWAQLDSLEPFRAARLIADLELVRPGLVPRARLRTAVDTMALIENRSLHGVLSRALDGAWSALESYLDSPVGDEGALVRLYLQTGCGGVRLSWRRGSFEHEIVAGPGGSARLEARVASGLLVMRSDRIDPILRSLFALAVRDWRPPTTSPPAGSEPAEGMVGSSPSLLVALDRIRRFAHSDIPVLIQGESGTGKELAARALHSRGPRAAAAFVPLNSAALTENLVLSELFGHVRGAFTGADRDRAGAFEAARGGTVFLDEIGDLPSRAQAMLLRVLQEGEVRRIGSNRIRTVDARVVAATHRRLERQVERGRFREDLFYRLAVGRVELPPLREREGDLDLLIDHFLQRFAPHGRLAISVGARERLRAHPWPGNVRELGNRLAVAVALASGGTIRERDLELPQVTDGRARGGYHQRVLDFRRRLVRDALHDSGGNRAAAARRLGVSRQALSYLVRTLGLT